MENKTNDKHSHMYWLDFTRVFACMCVVMLHSMGYYITSASMYRTKTWYVCLILNAVVRTGVPLFLMMSGYLLLKNPIKESSNSGSSVVDGKLDFLGFYKKRLSRILLPFIVWDIVYFFYFRYVNGNIAGIKDFFGELINNGSAYHLWYVYTLTAIYLIAPFLQIIVQRCSTKQLFWLLFIIIFAGTIRPFLNTIFPIYIYLSEPVAEGYIGYFLLGYILGKIEIKKPLRLLIYFGGICGAVFGVWQNYISSSAESIVLASNGGYAINQYLCAAAIFILFKYTLKFGKSNASSKITVWVLKFITLLSSVTYGIYLAHPLVLEIIRRNPTIFSPAVDIVICFAAAFIIPAVLCMVISKFRHVGKFIM